ncbi:hypothetical protein D0A39_10455 [Xanthomonas campestris pv. campestris]|nr:hypothetical protein D0A39_10455 [Xanthomonas campestris pv. campestris]
MKAVSGEAARASKLHQASLAPSSAPTGHLLPRGEGTVKPLSAARGSWGEGGKRRSSTCIQTPPGFARTLIRPYGAPSPEGRRNSQASLHRERELG